MSHYTEEELADYAFDPRGYREKVEIEGHLAVCPECRDRLAFIERIDGALREPIPWEISDDIRSETPPPPEVLRSRARIIDEEAAGARALLSPLLTSPLPFRNARVENDARFHTTGAVAALYRAARELSERQPQFALLVVNAAVSVATKLATARTLRSNLHFGRAYLERGWILFLIGRYKDAELSLDRAENIYDQEPEATGWDLAWVWLVRANIYVESERMGPGRLLALAAARQFRIFGDSVRYLNARLLLASVLFMEGDYRASAEAAEEIILLARPRRNLLLLGRALQNCAEAYLLVREFDKALPLYLEAYAIWDELGLDLERIRTNWSLATLDAETGKLDDGITRLDETYRALEALGVTNDAALARMQLGETLLRAGRPETVPDLLRDVVVNFVSEGMMRNARIALASLHEAIEQNRLSADLVRHVRTYIEQLPFQPTLAFVPLQ
jgi:tetratricopeptide (TPR) repeat protein